MLLTTSETVNSIPFRANILTAYNQILRLRLFCSAPRVPTGAPFMRPAALPTLSLKRSTSIRVRRGRTQTSASMRRALSGPYADTVRHSRPRVRVKRRRGPGN